MQSPVLSRRLRLLVLFTFFVAALATGSAQQPNRNDHVAVMISIDGLAAHYIDDPRANIPTLRALALEGARAANMKPVAPTVTWPNHTTLVTGVTPAKHGVVGNNYLDRATGEHVTLISDPVFDKDQIVKVPTIYDLAKAAGMKTAAILWPASRNAHTLDWTLPDVVLPELTKKYSTPALVEECEQAGIPIDGTHAKNGVRQEPDDQRNVDIFKMVLQKHRPQLALLHLIATDHTQHQNGPDSPEAFEAIHKADTQVREIWELLQKEFPHKATLFVVSDHGFSEIQGRILPNVVLKKPGLYDPSKPARESKVQVVAQAGSAFVYIQDQKNRDATLNKVKSAFRRIPGVAKILEPKDFSKYGVADPKADPHAPDLILFADYGKVFGDTAAGDLPFSVKPERKGSHGHDPNYPNLQAVFIACGEGIKPGVQLGNISNLSVAPTLARILGIDMPTADGPVLEAALTPNLSHAQAKN
jgi:predicted AlkP superfamily pyrophosphatase or phosphodiesterase